MAATIDQSTIRQESGLLDEAMKAQLANVFAKMEKNVTMKAVVDLSNDQCREMAELLCEMEKLGDKLDLELYTLEEAEQAAELDITYLPVTGLYREGQYGRVSFHGVPGGKEMNSFVLAIYNLAGPGQTIPGRTLKKIEKLKKPANIKVCVSLACHHCPLVVTAAQQIAIYNPNITAEMIDARLYPELVEQYHIERVPMTIINNKEVYVGNKTIDDILFHIEKLRG